MKPSSDIEISDVSLPIAAFLIVSAFEDLDRFRIKNSSSAAGVVQQPVRDECLNINMFSSLVQAPVVISDWKAGLQPPLATLRARLPGASCLRCSPHPSMIDSH